MTKLDLKPEAPSYFNDCLPWQQSHWKRITLRFPNIPHAILLTGMQGSGKRQFADQLAAWLLCLNQQPNHACGECNSCQWLKSDTHPSLLRISPETDTKGKLSQVIKIDQIRDLMPFVQQTGKGWRAIIIEPAEALNIAAANALLKTLEEPGEQVSLILISDQPLQLPATIRSRLQQYKVGEVSTPDALSYMVREANLNTEQAELLLRIAGGAPLAALSLSEELTFLARHDWLNDWQSLLQQQISPMSLSSTWQKRLNLTQWLSVLQWMIRDAIAAHLQQPVIQTDLNFDQIIQHVSLDRLFELQQHIFAAIKGQTQNIQSGLVYDSLMMQLTNLR